VRFSRHARNRVRWIARSAPSVSQEEIRAALEDRPTSREYDERGNLRAQISVGGIALTVLLDEDEGLIVTVWRD
jgi:hypothetical protein